MREHTAPRRCLTYFSRFALSAACTAALLSISPRSTHAEDLGSYGHQWNIEEEDGVQQMIDKLKKMKEDGTLDKIQKQYQQDFIDRMNNPTPIAGISKATKARTYTVDPSITVQEPIRNEEGAVMVAPGTRINPLDFTKWSKSVVLIDARDEDQVDFVRQRLIDHPNDKIILVGGSFIKLMKELKVRVYYDLGGAFTKRFNLTKVPAVVSQAGKVLHVQELVLGQEAGQ